ncbi:hypothetical protein LUZ60_007845 [Juncus effusus]|nr:hypothetical protein LUZ60_007845 [Juncus effusus]
MNLLLLLLLLLTITAASFSPSIADGDALIRQVVSEEKKPSATLGAEAQFESFKSTYGKSYADEEEHSRRFKIFKANLRRAQRHQLLDPTASHGMTKFADMTPAEFRKTYFGLKKGARAKLRQVLESGEKAEFLDASDLPTEFDWRDKGAVTAVKDQGSCGSCWSFSASGALEGANYLANGNLVSLSEQQLVDCDQQCDSDNVCDAGCNGGLMTNAFEYLKSAGGLESEADYPYTGTDGTCAFKKSKIVAKVKNYTTISTNEDQIMANLYKHGPLAIGINAAFMQTYISGVSCPYICIRTYLDHGVLLVGWGSSGFAPARLKNKPYWIIKNSWGSSWGEEGYYKICRGYNACGVNNMVSTVTALTTSS